MENIVEKVIGLGNWIANQILVVKDLHLENTMWIFDLFCTAIFILKPYYELWKVAGSDTFMVNFYIVYVLFNFHFFGFTNKVIFSGGLMIMGVADEFNITRIDWISAWASIQIIWGFLLLYISMALDWFSMETIAKNSFLAYFHGLVGQITDRRVFTLLISAKHKWWANT